jgi:retron-type reverse transcriptase
MKNLELAWQKVRRNRGAGGIDGQSVGAFEENLAENLNRLHKELRDDTYRPQPVRQKMIPKPGQPDKLRPLGIPVVYDRVCQQALLNRLEPIFEPVFDDANYGYRKGRSAKDALRKIWKELQEGHEWIVDADLKDFFWISGSRKAHDLGTSAHIGWTCAQAYREHTQGRMLCAGQAATDRVRYATGWGHITPVEQHPFNSV